MISDVRKRDGNIQAFSEDKITRAIFKAAKACGGNDYDTATGITHQVIASLKKTSGPVDIESIQDAVEKTLIENGHAKTAKRYILYRHQRQEARNHNALIGATTTLMNNYLNEDDWQIKENANGSDRSVMALYNYTREEFVKLYWLHEIYPAEVANAHESGDIHIHDLGFLAPYCTGWDLFQLIRDGFTGSRQSSKPASHFSTILGQLANSIFATQQENAGAQAFSSFDTYLAPFVRHDKLTYEEVRRHLRSFIFEINMPMRVGGQAPFSNITMDLTCPSTIANTQVIIGGKVKDSTYDDYQTEMDMINRAFVECMLDGDAEGRFFTFPVVTLNVTPDFPWETPVGEKWMELTTKFGAPYFANYLNADLSPEDARSMCCRLRLDNRVLRKRGGGLFGSNPLTGSIGVVTLNLPRIGFMATSEDDYFRRLQSAIDIAIVSLEMKRKYIEKWTQDGLYPYCQNYLKQVYETTGKYWHNHFSTIGLVGMNESLENFIKKDIGSDKGLDMAYKIMNYIRGELEDIQESTGNLYNLEATPAESTAYRLALKDKKRFLTCFTQGSDDCPYYTNSSQLPPNYSQDLYHVVALQDQLQASYTGGTVLHLYSQDKITDTKTIGAMIKNIFTQHNLPYLSYTPTFSHCHTHGYVKGEVDACPTCNSAMDIYSRVTGYYRPVKRFNEGKQQEYKDRTPYQI